MNRFITIAIVLLSISSAFAQQKSGLDFYETTTEWNPSSLVDFPEVQREIRLSTAQLTEIEAKESEARKSRAGKSFGKEVAEERRQEDLKIVASVVNPEQNARLIEITLQVEGLYALLRKDVAEALSLSSDQRYALEAAINQRRDGKRLPGPGLGRRKTRAELEPEIKQVLTEQQSTDFEKLQGKKVGFDIKKFRPKG
jgi:hypothetical protein